jgi:murein DD-endopeptidase MepM/ murein hydrolase activator NlpD
MRKRKLGLERPVLAGLGLAALMATCTTLAAGWYVAGDLAAGVHAAHLPTPAASYATPGAGVQWRWQTPSSRSKTGASVQAAILPTPTASGVADPWQSPAPVPESKAGAQTAQEVSFWLEASQEEPIGLPQPEREEVPAMASMPEIRRPVAGRISQAYGCSPYYSGIPGPGCPVEAFWFHDGVDIAVAVGTPVQAGLAGRVTFAAADGDGPLCNRGYRGYGLAVMVDAGNGWQTLYAHLSRIDVQEGQAVEPETLIGLSGDTGCASGAHLHFGLRHDGELVDPLEVIQ